MYTQCGTKDLQEHPNSKYLRYMTMVPLAGLLGHGTGVAVSDAVKAPLRLLGVLGQNQQSLAGSSMTLECRSHCVRDIYSDRQPFSAALDGHLEPSHSLRSRSGPRKTGEYCLPSDLKKWSIGG